MGSPKAASQPIPKKGALAPSPTATSAKSPPQPAPEKKAEDDSLPLASCDIEIQGGASNGTRSTRTVNGILPNRPAQWSHGLVLNSFDAKQAIVFNLNVDPTNATDDKSLFIGKARLRG